MQPVSWRMCYLLEKSNVLVINKLGKHEVIQDVFSLKLVDAEWLSSS